MKRKVVSVLLIAAMSVGMLAGCGQEKVAVDNGGSSKAESTERNETRQTGERFPFPTVVKS